MIDAKSETLLSLTDVAKSLPSRPSVSTIWRWQNRGIRGVRLETMLVGGRRMTSTEAIDRFLAAINAVTKRVPCELQGAQRQRDRLFRAEKRAEEFGI